MPNTKKNYNNKNETLKQSQTTRNREKKTTTNKKTVI